MGLAGATTARNEEADASPVGPLDQRVTRIIELHGTCNRARLNSEGSLHICDVYSVVSFEGVFESIELIAGPNAYSDIRYHILAQTTVGADVPHSTYDTGFLRLGQSTGPITPRAFSPAISTIVGLNIRAEGRAPLLPDGWLPGWKATVKITSIIRQRTYSSGLPTKKKKRKKKKQRLHK